MHSLPLPSHFHLIFFLSRFLFHHITHQICHFSLFIFFFYLSLPLGCMFIDTLKLLQHKTKGHSLLYHYFLNPSHFHPTFFPTSPFSFSSPNILFFSKYLSLWVSLSCWVSLSLWVTRSLSLSLSLLLSFYLTVKLVSYGNTHVAQLAHLNTPTSQYPNNQIKWKS